MAFLFSRPIMRSYVGTFALILIAAFAWADESTLRPQPGVLLLRNGSVLEGSILRSGDRYDVGFQDGDLRVRVSDVEFAGSTLDECYEHRRRSIGFDKVEDHLGLAEWCLQHQLHAAAGRELRDAVACDPSHPRTLLVERRLRLAMEGPGDARTTEPGRIDAARPEELDRMVRTMPPGAVEAFTNVIQPMLLNHCSTASCHGPTSSTSLRLMRIASNRTQSRRATQRNLHSVLSVIDNQHPDASLLLTMPIRPHGTSRAAVFSSKQTFQYKQLVDWAYAVANKKRVEPESDEGTSTDWPLAEEKPKRSPKNPAVNSTVPSRAIAAKYLDKAETHERVNTRAVDNPFEKIKPAAAHERWDDTPATKDESDKPDQDLDPYADVPRAPPRLSRRYLPGQRPPRSTPKSGEVPKEQTPVDPFDPEQFNRKYLGG
jgi:hypothetical protein